MPGKRHAKAGYHGEVEAPLPLSQIQQTWAILVSLHVPLHRDRMAGAGLLGVVMHSVCTARLCTVCARPGLGGGVSPALSRLVKPLVLVQGYVNPQGSFIQLSGNSVQAGGNVIQSRAVSPFFSSPS